MKGQNEVLIFILLLIIGTALFTSATIWSKGIFQQNVDLARVENSEKFIKDLNGIILDIIKFGGSQEIKYNLYGTIELNTTSKNIIELKVPVQLNLPTQWVTISNDTYFIQEKLEGNALRIQLVYPNSTYGVVFFTDGSILATPASVLVERNQTYIDSGLTIIKIKVTFA